MVSDRSGARTIVLCALAAMAEGFDNQSMGVAAPRMAPALGLTREQLGPAFSASVFGLLIGAVLIGRIADRWGRKGALVASLTVFGAFSIATAFAPDLNSLLAMRVLAGLGLGGAMPNLVALTAEASAAERRPMLVTLMTAGLSLGAAVAGLVAAALPWRGVFWVGGLTPLALAGLAWAALPESAAFQAVHGAEAGEGRSRTGVLEVLFGEGRALPTLLQWAASFCALLTLYLLLNWLPTLMALKGAGRTAASLVSVLFNLGGAAGIAAGAVVLGRALKRVSFGLWFAALAVSLAGLALAPAELAALGPAAFVAGAFVSSAPLMLLGLAPGYYGVAIRGTGVGVLVAVGRSGAVVGPLAASALLGAGAGADGVLLAMLPLTAIAAAATLALLGCKPTA